MMVRSLALLLFVGCFGIANTASSAEKKAEKTQEKKSETKAESKIDSKLNKKGKPMFATFDTSMGKFKAKLFADQAPITVENFAGLADGSKEWTHPKTGKKETKPLYSGTIFHRVIPGFMIQGGDPIGTGTGDPGYSFADEIHPELKHTKAGLLSMANAGPGPDGKGTNGSQFFVTVAATPWLDGKHTIFGEVIEGMDVVMEISKTKTKAGDKPVTDVTIKSITIEREK